MLILYKYDDNNVMIFSTFDTVHLLILSGKSNIINKLISYCIRPDFIMLILGVKMILDLLFANKLYNDFVNMLY